MCAKRSTIFHRDVQNGGGNSIPLAKISAGAHNAIIHNASTLSCARCTLFRLSKGEQGCSYWLCQ